MIPMQALKSFNGRPGEGERNRVRRGREFRVGDEYRARDLERMGLAVRVVRPPEAPAQFLSNEAAARGPFVSRGGETGAGTPPSSSPADQAPRNAISDQREADRASSASTNPGNSRQKAASAGRTRSMDATGRGGSTADRVPSLLD
jgi:hypothetical protein